MEENKPELTKVEAELTEEEKAKQRAKREAERKKRAARAAQEAKRKYFEYYDDIKYDRNKEW